MRPPSLQKRRDFISEFDAAIATPPDDASDEEKSEFAAAMLRARETGDYAPVLKPGVAPVKFVLEPIRETAFLALIDAVGSRPLALFSTAFRMACVGIVGALDEDGQPVTLPKRERHPEYGELLPLSIIDTLGAHYRPHVQDAAQDILTRARSTGPKS